MLNKNQGMDDVQNQSVTVIWAMLCFFLAGHLLDLSVDHEDGDSTFL
jgi:hypothetical protein